MIKIRKRLKECAQRSEGTTQMHDARWAINETRKLCRANKNVVNTRLIQMSESVEESSGSGAAMVGVLDVVLVLVFVAVVVLIVMRFRRKRAEQNKLKDLKINTM